MSWESSASAAELLQRRWHPEKEREGERERKKCIVADRLHYNIKANKLLKLGENTMSFALYR